MPAWHTRAPARVQGIWRPRQVPNPHYWEEEAPLAGIGMIGAIAVEVGKGEERRREIQGRR